jgi:hypothetical protein
LQDIDSNLHNSLYVFARGSSSQRNRRYRDGSRPFKEDEIKNEIEFQKNWSNDGKESQTTDSILEIIPYMGYTYASDGK